MRILPILTEAELSKYKSQLEDKINLPRLQYPHCDPLIIDGFIVHEYMDIKCLTGEKFEDISNVKNYKVSNYGRVMHNDKICKLEVIGTFLDCTAVYVSGRGNTNVYRLVKETFDPVVDMNRFEVHHINNNALDNRVDNLIWVTREEHNKIDVDFNKKLRTISKTIYKKNRKELIEYFKSNNGKKIDYKKLREYFPYVFYEVLNYNIEKIIMNGNVSLIYNDIE